MIRCHYRSQLCLLLALVGLLLVPGALTAAPLERLTALRAGTFSTFTSRVSLTDDGRGVCFDGRSNGYWTGDMFLPDSVGVWKYDFTSYLLSLLTRSAGGQYPKGRCQDPIISGDGAVVLFENSAADLTPSPLPDGLYTYDLVKGGYDRCDVSSNDLILNDRGMSGHPCLSRGGRYVVFVTNARLASNDKNDTADLYLRDRVARRTTLQSVSTQGKQATGDNKQIECAVSADGKAIVFTSDAVGLVPEVVTPGHRVYLRRVTGAGGTTICVSTTGLSVPVGGWYPSISGDGRMVAFCTPVSLARGDVSGNWDVFVADTVADTDPYWASAPISVSLAAAGDSNTGSGCPALSYDGRYVVFQTNDYRIFSKTSTATKKWQVILKDLATDNSTVLSSPAAGAYGNDDSRQAAISANGDRVAFLSKASNLVSGDTNGYQDVFARRTSYAIYGKVSTSSNKPLLYTSVVAINKNTKAEHWAYCAVNGNYCLSGLNSGDYDVWAFKAGYRFAPASHTLTLNGLTGAQDFVGRPATGDGIVTYRALLVGISTYLPGGSNLIYADQDARDVRAALLTGANWKAANISSLLNTAATRDAVKKAIAGLMARCDADDVCVIWWSSHGSWQNDRAPYDELDHGDETLLPADSKPILDDVFGHWLNRCGTSNYFLGLDCCYSGGQINAPGKEGAAPSQSDWLSGFLADFRGPDPGAKDLDDNQCGVVLASAYPSETAQESAKFKNGVFTHFLTQGIGNRVCDTDKDSWLTPGEMMNYARQRTIDFSESEDRPQTPMQFAASGLLDLPIIGAKTTPDLRIGNVGETLVGHNIFSTNGVHQEDSNRDRPGTLVTWSLIVENDSTVARQIRIKGGKGSSSFVLTYYDLDGGNAALTSAVTGAGWLTPRLPAHGLRHLAVKVKTPLAEFQNMGRQLITATFADDSSRSDTVAISASTSTNKTPPALQITGLAAVPTGVGAEISFGLQSAAQVQVRLRNLAGRTVRTLVADSRLEAGTQRLLWDGRSDGGTLAPPGTYLVEVSARAAGGASVRTITGLRR